MSLQKCRDLLGLGGPHPAHEVTGKAPSPATDIRAHEITAHFTPQDSIEVPQMEIRTLAVATEGQDFLHQVLDGIVRQRPVNAGRRGDHRLDQHVIEGGKLVAGLGRLRVLGLRDAGLFSLAASAPRRGHGRLCERLEFGGLTRLGQGLPVGPSLASR